MTEAYLLNIKEWKCNGFPKVIAIFTCHFEVFIKFLFNQWIVLHSNRIPHEILGKIK